MDLIYISDGNYSILSFRIELQKHLKHLCTNEKIYMNEEWYTGNRKMYRFDEYDGHDECDGNDKCETRCAYTCLVWQRID